MAAAASSLLRVLPSCSASNTHLSIQQTRPNNLDVGWKSHHGGRSPLRLECEAEKSRWTRRSRGKKCSLISCAQVADSSPTLNAEEPNPQPVSSKLVLVVGATGGVGQFIVASLLEKGVKVRALVRSPQKAISIYASRLGEQMEFKVGDTREPGTLDESVFEGVTHVIHATGTTAFPTKRWSGGNGPEQTDWIAVRNFVDALPKTLQRVILVTSIAVTKYDKFPFFILNLFGVLKYKKMGEDYLRESGIPFTIIRPGQLPDGPPKPVDEGQRKVVLGEGDKLTGKANRVDIAEACVQSLDLAFTAGQTYEVICEKGPGPGKDAEKWSSLFSGIKSSST